MLGTNETTNFMVVNRQTLRQRTFNTAHDAALWMVGKDIRHYFIIKQTTTIIDIVDPSFDEMKKQFQEA